MVCSIESENLRASFLAIFATSTGLLSTKHNAILQLKRTCIDI